MIPDPDLVRCLELTVRPLAHRPHRWAWDLRDGRDSSWFESMWEFDSEERARRSGAARLMELSRLACGGSTPLPRIADEPRHLVIVARHADDLYALFTGAFRGSATVTVIRDRRTSSPRIDDGPDRRSIDAAGAIRARGWMIVGRSRAQRGGLIDAAA